MPTPSLVIRTSPAFFINSMIAVPMALAISRVVGHLGVAVAGVVAGRDPVLTNVMTLLRRPGSPLIELARPAACLILGVILLILYPGSKDRSAGRLMMLWTLLFCFQNAMTEVAMTTFDDTSVISTAIVDNGLPANVPTIVSVIGIVGLLLVALGAAPAFLAFSRHRSEVKNVPERLRFLSSVALAPGLFGPLLAIPMFLPDQGTGLVASLPVAGLFVIVTTLAGLRVSSVAPPEIVEERGLAIGLILSYGLMFLLFRFGLAPGLLIPPWDDTLRLTWRP